MFSKSLAVFQLPLYHVNLNFNAGYASSCFTVTLRYQEWAFRYNAMCTSMMTGINVSLVYACSVTFAHGGIKSSHYC